MLPYSIYEGDEGVPSSSGHGRNLFFLRAKFVTNMVRVPMVVWWSDDELGRLAGYIMQLQRTYMLYRYITLYRSPASFEERTTRARTDAGKERGPAHVIDRKNTLYTQFTPQSTLASAPALTNSSSTNVGAWRCQAQCRA